MKYHELSWFIKLAETQHETWIADEMDITQPTLSRAISRLEREVGVPLFSRVGRRLELNEYGKVFYEYARSAVTELEIGQIRVAELASKAQHHIRIGTLHGLVPILIQSLVNVEDVGTVMANQRSIARFNITERGQKLIGHRQNTSRLEQHPGFLQHEGCVEVVRRPHGCDQFRLTIGEIQLQESTLM